MAVGVALIVIGAVVHLVGTHWIDVTLPPVVTGAIVALIGFNLAPAAKANFEKGPLVGLVTLVLLVATLAFFRGIIGRLAIFLAVVAGYLLALILGDVDTSAIKAAPWLGLPEFQTPTFTLAVLPMFLPAVIALVAENIGHVKSVGQMTDTDVDPVMGRALAADGVATTLAGFGGGFGDHHLRREHRRDGGHPRLFDGRVLDRGGGRHCSCRYARRWAPRSRRSPQACSAERPSCCTGWSVCSVCGSGSTNRVDFSKPLNQMTAAIPLIIGIADFTWHAGNLTFTGIALGSIAALLVYHGMRLLGFRQARERSDAADPAAEPR